MGDRRLAAHAHPDPGVHDHCLHRLTSTHERGERLERPGPRAGRRGANAAGSATSRFPVADPAGLPADLAQRYAEEQERSGFLPNVFAALAWRPDEARAFFAMNDALMDKDTPGLSLGERELIVVATSAANGCAYCVVAPSAIARIRTHDPLLADLVAVDWRKAPLDQRMHTVLDVAVRLALDPAAVTAADLDRLREHGLTDDDVWDVGAITAFFGLSNRLAHFAAVPPNPEFYLLGRLPRER